MNKRYHSLASIVTCCLLLLLISGCGSSGNKEGENATSVSTVSAASCVTCHSTSVETMTGEPIVTNYTASVHNLNSVGCQDCHGAGGSHNGVGPIPYPKPNYVQCKSCHDSGKLVTQYSTSKHLLAAATGGGDKKCNRCHTHQGAVLSAISHYTGDGTAIAAGVGAPGAIPDAEPIKCNTCHETHDVKTIGSTSLNLRVDTAWAPSRFVIPLLSNGISRSTTTATLTAYGHGFANGASVTISGAVPAAYNGTFTINTVTPHTFKYTMLSDPGSSATTQGVIRTTAVASTNAQFRLCTQCHGYTNPAGLVMASGTSGTAPAGGHADTWSSIIATTHYRDPAALAAGNLTGYGMRFTLPDGSENPNPCFDCHGHEAMTNTGSGSPTIYTDWAKSGHARGLLTAKLAAAGGGVDAVMAASVTPGAFAGHTGSGCGRCHTAEGFAQYFETFTTTNMSNNEPGIIKCYACHSNPGAGTLRRMSGASATPTYTGSSGWNPTAGNTAGVGGYALNYGKLPYPDMAASNICITCHDSRQSDPGATIDTTTSYIRTHYLQAATTMFVKMGFITFAPGALPGVTIDTSLLSDQDGGTITSTHRKLGTPAMVGDHGITAADTKLISRGPCVTCHFSGSHSQKIDQRAIDAVCSKCHTSELGHSIATKADFDTYFLEPQSEAYQAALTLAMTVFNNKATGITITSEAAPMDTFVRAYVTSALPTLTESAAGNWTTAMTVLGGGYNKARVMGAVSNIVMFKRDPGAYAHARTYSRRLIYDSIDYLDDGIMNGSVGATALATMPGVYGKGAAAFTNSNLDTLSPGTTEAMVYLIKWSRTTGAWSSPERP